MAKLIPKNVDHVKRVCSLYKKALRTLESYYDDRAAFRYRAVLMRDRFDKTRSVIDERRALKLVEDGEQELFENQHYQPRQCKVYICHKINFHLILICLFKKGPCHLEA